jgi:hypothetical protein
VKVENAGAKQEGVETGFSGQVASRGQIADQSGLSAKLIDGRMAVGHEMARLCIAGTAEKGHMRAIVAKTARRK